MSESNNDDPIHNVESVFVTSVLTRRAKLHINDVGSNIDEILHNYITRLCEGKCIEEGFVKKNTCKIISVSSGQLHNEFVIYLVHFKCEMCNIVSGMKIECFSRNITKAGIRAVMSSGTETPVMIFCTSI